KGLPKSWAGAFRCLSVSRRCRRVWTRCLSAKSPHARSNGCIDVTGKTQQATRSLGGRPAAADASASWCSRLVVTLRRSFPSEADLPGQVLALSIPAALVSLPLYGAIYAVRGEYLIAFLHALALGAILFVRRFWKILDRPAWALHTLVLCLSGVLAPTIYLEGGLMSTS